MKHTHTSWPPTQSLTRGKKLHKFGLKNLDTTFTEDDLIVLGTSVMFHHQPWPSFDCQFITRHSLLYWVGDTSSLASFIKWGYDLTQKFETWNLAFLKHFFVGCLWFYKQKFLLTRVTRKSSIHAKMLPSSSSKKWVD